MERFVIQDLGTPEPIFTQIQKTEQGNTSAVLLECLIRYRNMQECSGNDVKSQLEGLIEKLSSTYSEVAASSRIGK